jgi:Transposase DDE domain
LTLSAWEAFEEDQECVRSKLQEGFIDFLEVVSRVVETQFFQELIGSGDLERLAMTYPSPRRKHDVPLWIYVATQLTLRLHGASGFSSLPYILHCGGLRDALEAGQVQRRGSAECGERYLEFKGYNHKNSYARRTPCDHDFVRKLAKSTEPRELEAWLGRDVARYLGSLGVYEEEGIFALDGSYLFVPDNPAYEGSKLAFFDEHNHPVSKDEEMQLSAGQKKRCCFRRYYRMASLVHTNRRQEFLLFVGARLLRQEGHEVKALLPLVEDFIVATKKGTMKLLLLDRGFIDGHAIGQIKGVHGVDVVIPLRAGMTITDEAWRLSSLDGKPWDTWTPPPKPPLVHPPQRPEAIRKAEERRQRTLAEKKARRLAPPRELVRIEIKTIPRISIWDECPVPLDVVLMREHFTDGSVSSWGLMTTRQVENPWEIRELYRVRTASEEGWRQTKCYWDLTGFRSRSMALITSQVIFVLLAYTLLQVFLLRSERRELAKQTKQRLLAQLLPEGEQVAVYWQNRVGYFGIKEYSDILLNLPEGPRRRLQGTIRRLKKIQSEAPTLPRRPTI